MHPGEDYKYRKTPSFKENHILTENLDRYHEYADLVVSVNGFFTNPDNPIFTKERYYIDVNGNQLKQTLLNKSEVSSVCDQILNGLEELKAYQKI